MNFINQHWRWGATVWIAFVFVQSLFFKFTNSYETQHIFGTLAEWSGLPWFGMVGGFVIGGAELVASIMLFTRWWALASVLSFGIMSGALTFHLFTPLGIVMPAFDANGAVVGDDGGTLFIMACLVWLCALALIIKDWTAANSQLRGLLGRG